MNVVWDSNKAESNFRKHGVRFSDAELVLWDQQGITVEDESSEFERRYITIGSDSIGRIVVVIYAIRGDKIRLISARKATRKERKAYEEGI